MLIRRIFSKPTLHPRQWRARRTHHRHSTNDEVRSNLTHSDRLKFKTITIADVHKRDIIDLFVEHHINDARHFQWVSRLRFHWLKDADNIFIEHYSGTRFSIT